MARNKFGVRFLDRVEVKFGSLTADVLWMLGNKEDTRAICNSLAISKESLAAFKANLARGTYDVCR